MYNMPVGFQRVYLVKRPKKRAGGGELSQHTVTKRRLGRNKFFFPLGFPKKSVGKFYISFFIAEEIICLRKRLQDSFPWE